MLGFPSGHCEQHRHTAPSHLCSCTVFLVPLACHHFPRRKREAIQTKRGRPSCAATCLSCLLTLLTLPNQWHPPLSATNDSLWVMWISPVRSASRHRQGHSLNDVEPAGLLLWTSFRGSLLVRSPPDQIIQYLAANFSIYDI